MRNFEDLKKLYNKMQERRGEEAYRYVQEFLQEAQELHGAYLAEHEPHKDKGQSWRSFKGQNFEKLIQYIITESIEALGLKMVNGKKLESVRLPQQLDAVKRNVTVNYGEFGLRLPDADIIVYNPENSQVIAVISSKTSLRERIAQTGYWKLKLLESQNTAHIKVYLVTPDTDKDLTQRHPARKPRVIAEVELDGTYVLTKENLEESDNVKLFEHFIEDFKQLIEENQ